MPQANGFEFPGDLYYDRRDHFWARLEGGRVRVGLDMLAQKSAGPVKHIQLKPVGTTVAKKRMFGTIEAGKYVGALRAPVGGTLVEVNEEVIRAPGLVNEDPYGQGWFVVIEPSSLEADLKDLVHDEKEVQAWLEQEIMDYRLKGLLKE
ncbi:MAG: glycine cleavage system protein H [Dehalococcoidia bacterium]|nr:glycine cleavage system protein H [Dehalococcoidia bacterium]